MTNRWKFYGKQIGLMFSCLLVATCLNVALAQATNEEGEGGSDPDIPDIPLDGGLSILLAAGAAYGGKKVYDMKRSKKEEQH